MTDNIATRCPECNLWIWPAGTTVQGIPVGVHAPDCPTLKPEPHPLGIGPSDWAVGESNSARTIVYEKQNSYTEVASVKYHGINADRPSGYMERRAFLMAGSPKLWSDASAVIGPLRDLIAAVAGRIPEDLVSQAQDVLADLEASLHACTWEGASLRSEDG